MESRCQGGLERSKAMEKMEKVTADSSGMWNVESSTPTGSGFLKSLSI